MSGPMRRTAPIKMIEGPSIRPPSSLLEWLDKNARFASGMPRLFRLPVVIHFQDEYHLELGDAFIGISEDSVNIDSVMLSLDTGTMGVSLWSLLNNLCPKTSNVCSVWLDGYWGHMVGDAQFSGSNIQKMDGKRPFAVLRLHGLIDARARRSVLHAMMEDE